MAQVYASSPEVIFNVLANDTTFSSYLGDYVFSSGGTTSSIAITTPGTALPQLESQTGLECIIHDVGDIKRRDYLTDDSDMEVVWRLYLIVWDPATGSDATAAAKRIMSLFRDAVSYETIATAQGLGARVQTAVQIPSTASLSKEAVEILASLD